jgi:hypothetical protein
VKVARRVLRGPRGSNAPGLPDRARPPDPVEGSDSQTFTRGDVILAAAPHLHGLPISVDKAVETVLANNDAVGMPIVTGTGSRFGPQFPAIGVPHGEVGCLDSGPSERTPV